MRFHLTIDPDLVPRIRELSRERKPQRVINDELRRAAEGDPQIAVLEAQLAALREEVERLHATLRAVEPAREGGRDMPSPPPKSVLAENDRRKLGFD